MATTPPAAATPAGGSVQMKINYANILPTNPEDSHYRYMYVMTDEELRERGGLKPGEVIDDDILPGCINAAPIHPVPTSVADARVLPVPPSLADAGFELGRHDEPSSPYDFGEYEEASYQKWLQADLLPKSAQQVSRACEGAFGPVASVHCLDYTFRATDGVGPSRKPVAQAHGDFTPESGARRIVGESVEFKLGDEAPITMEDGPIMVNLWQPLVPVVYRKTLAMCDIRTAEPSDYVRKKMIFRHRVGETYNIKHGEGQKWYYYPHMTNGECLVFLTWTPGGKTIPHSGAVDPSDPEDSPPRRSMETRWIVKFKEPFSG